MIKVKSLSKSFRIQQRRAGLRGHVADLFHREFTTVKAVDNIDLNIEKGELVGYIGPNGAGKSTTVKMLCGVLYPDQGKILVNEIDPFKHRQANNMNIGVVFGQRSQLWGDLAVQESLILLRKIYRVSDKDFQKRMQLLDEILSIKDLLSTPVRKLSLGQRMRCEFASALIHWPEVLFLDEPTIGIDIMTRKRIIQFIDWLNKECKKTVLLTTHNMQDIETLCKRVILLDKGKIIYDDSLQLLKQANSANKRITVNFDEPITLEVQSFLSKYSNFARIDFNDKQENV